NGRSTRRIQNTIKRVRPNGPVLVKKGRLERWIRNEIASTKGRLGTELLQHQLLDWVIEHAPTHGDAGLTWPAGQRAQEAVGCAGTPVQSQTWRERFVVGTGEAQRHALIARENQAG